MRALAILVLMAGVAHGESDPPPPLHRRSLGLQLQVGDMPLEGQSMVVFGAGVTFEQRLAGSLRALAEYEFVWTDEPGDDAEDTTTDGGGHRGLLGARIRLGEARPRIFKNQATFYVDLDGGGGLIRATDPMGDVFQKPFAFVGLRAGYGFHELRHGTTASTTYEAAFGLRAIKTTDGTGIVGTIGISWGD